MGQRGAITLWTLVIFAISGLLLALAQADISRSKRALPTDNKNSRATQLAREFYRQNPNSQATGFIDALNQRLANNGFRDLRAAIEPGVSGVYRRSTGESIAVSWEDVIVYSAKQDIHSSFFTPVGRVSGKKIKTAALDKLYEKLEAIAEAFRTYAEFRDVGDAHSNSATRNKYNEQCDGKYAIRCAASPTLIQESFTPSLFTDSDAKTAYGYDIYYQNQGVFVASATLSISIDDENDNVGAVISSVVPFLLPSPTVFLLLSKGERVQ
ncbi:MAG: hypothetical protein ACNYPH_02530 [Gammaproteobacteria bacterium WSBS_2016_MAG_OTU1]